MNAALRWRAVGMCLCQQDSEQNRIFMRPELQDDTEQRRYLPPSSIGTLQSEQLQGAIYGFI
jgi:hypothetical protein